MHPDVHVCMSMEHARETTGTSRRTRAPSSSSSSSATSSFKPLSAAVSASRACSTHAATSHVGRAHCAPNALGAVGTDCTGSSDQPRQGRCTGHRTRTAVCGRRACVCGSEWPALALLRAARSFSHCFSASAACLRIHPKCTCHTHEGCACTRACMHGGATSPPRPPACGCRSAPPPACAPCAAARSGSPPPPSAHSTTRTAQATSGVVHSQERVATSQRRRNGARNARGGRRAAWRDGPGARGAWREGPVALP